MGLFDRFKKNKEDFGSPPDFSTPPNDLLGNDGDLLGNDPLANNNTTDYNPYSNPQGKAGSLPQNQSNFNHDIFSDNREAGGSARDYARTLGDNNGVVAQASQGVVRGAITGHEADLILERLDTIKAELDAIKQRMMRVERFMEQAEQKAGTRKYF